MESPAGVGDSVHKVFLLHTAFFACESARNDKCGSYLTACGLWGIIACSGEPETLRLLGAYATQTGSLAKCLYASAAVFAIAAFFSVILIDVQQSPAAIGGGRKRTDFSGSISAY